MIKLQDEQDNFYAVPHPTYKVSSEDNTANKSLRDQFTTYNKGYVQGAQNSKFQLSLFQTEHLGSHSDDQIDYTENNLTNNNNKSINELNDDEVNKSYANHYNATNQHTSEISQTTMNFITEQETKELCNSNRKRRQKNISRIQLTNEDLVEMDQEDDGEEEEYFDNQEAVNKVQKEVREDLYKKELNAEQTQQDQKKSLNVGSSIISGQSKSPALKTSNVNYFSNLKNIPSKISGESEFPKLKSEIAGNSVSQRRDDFSNLQLMNYKSNLDSQSNQQDYEDESNNKREKSKSIALNVIHALQKARQKHLEIARADKQTKIMNRVKDFIKVLKVRSKLRTPSLIQKKVLDVINDLVFVSRQNVSRLKARNSSFRMSRAMLKFQVFSSQSFFQIYHKVNIPLFHPQSKFKLVWDFIHILIIILIFIYIPIQIVTGQNMGALIQREDSWGVVIFFIFFFFIVDMLISFNTGIYDQGIVNENRKDVSLTYIKNQMILDFLYIISILKTYYDMESQYIFSIICCFIFLFKVLKVIKIVNNFTDILLSIRNNTKLYYLVQLLSLLGTILFVGHIFGCAFWKAAELNNDDQSKNWMKKIGIQDSSWQDKYLYSIYYSVTTMITVGYGDITPQNNTEILMAIIYMLLSSVIFGYSLNTIGGIIKEIQKDGHYIKEQMSLVNRYLNDKNIGRDLKVTIRMFLQYKLKSKNIISLEQEKYILDELSTHLREKLITEENMNIMRQCKSTFSNFSEECLQKLALRVKQVRVSKNEMIFEEGQLDDDPLFYFIQRGSIELFVESVKGDYNFTTLAILNEGKSLGEPSIYIDQIKTVSAKATEMSILRTLSRSDILDVLRFFPKDYEKFCFFRDEIQFNKLTSKFNQSCFICQSTYHTINQCPSLHFTADREQIILRHIYSQQQMRENTERAKQRKMNAVSNQNQIQQLRDAFISRQREEMMLLTWDSEENQMFMASEGQDESLINQTNRQSYHTTYTQRLNNNPQNNYSSVSNQKYSSNNLFLNRSKNTKSGFHPERTLNHHREGELISRRSRNDAFSSSSSSNKSPSSHSSHSSSFLSQSFVVLGRDKKSVLNQNQNQAIPASTMHTFQPSQQTLHSSQSSQNTNPLQIKGLFKMTETIDNPQRIEEEKQRESKQHNLDNQDESNKVSDQIGDERINNNYSIQFKRAESSVQKNAQGISSLSVVGGNGGSENNNFYGAQSNLTPEKGDRMRNVSITNTTKSNQKPPQAPSSTQPRNGQRALSIKMSSNTNLQIQNGNNNSINIIECYPVTNTNTLEVPRIQQRKESTDNNRMNTSLSHRSKQNGENDYNTGRTSYHNSQNQNLASVQQSGNYQHNSAFTFSNNNSHIQNNTAYFDNQAHSTQGKAQKIHFDKSSEIPFYNTNEITEESSTLSKQSVGINIIRGNSRRRSTKNPFKRQSHVNQSQFQQQYLQNQRSSTNNISDDTDQISKNIKLLISLLQEKSPNKNIPPIEGFSNKISNSPIPRKNTSITQPQSSLSQSHSKQQNFSTFYQNYLNQLNGNNQIPPPIGGLQNQYSQQSAHYQDNQVILNGIQPQQFLKRRKNMDDMMMNFIIQQNEGVQPNQQTNIPLIKNINSTITKDFKTLNSGIHNSGVLNQPTSPINHKQFQKNIVIQRQLDQQFSQKLAKFQTGNDLVSNQYNDKKTEKQKYEEFIQKDVLQDQMKEFTYYYPEHNLSQIIQNLKTLKVSFCSAFGKYTIYNYKNYSIYPYKQQNMPQKDQLKSYQNEL
ncbi:hypothetical protein ABPG74_022569 [Tetrahymena malaccensis]